MPEPGRSAALRAVLGDTNVIVPGCFDAASARESERAGARCLFLSGGSVARALFGDTMIRLSRLDDYVSVVQWVCATTPLPVLVDAEDGFGSPVEVADRLGAAGAAGVIIGDSDEEHLRPREYQEGVLSELRDRELVVVARCDALNEGVPQVRHRLDAYLTAGADWVMPLLVSVLDGTTPTDLGAVVEQISAGIATRTIVHVREHTQLPTDPPTDVAAYLITRELFDAARAGIRTTLPGVLGLSEERCNWSDTPSAARGKEQQ